MDLSSQVGAGDDGAPQVLWEDGERVLSRGWRLDADGNRCAVLVVLPAAEHPRPATLDRLAHEYGLREELDAAWAARPLWLGQERGRTTLVMEDPGGEPLATLLGQPMPLERFLPLAIGLAEIVAKLHRRGLVHKDLKPANILVNRASGEMRLTGFGIASRLLRERQAPEPPEFIAGTLAYMAPEQTGRMNRSINSRSDLYALGVTLLRNADGGLAVHRLRSDGMGALPDRATAGAARRAIAACPAADLAHRHEAARQDRRRALPDRRRRRARSAALPGRMGGPGSHRRLPAGRNRIRPTGC